MDDDLRFTLEDTATQEQVDTCNDIRKNYVDLNLQIMFIDQRLKELIRGCRRSDHNQNEALSLTKAVEQLKTDQESKKKNFQELLIRLFQSKCSIDIRILEGFLLEQEVYTLMRKAKVDELKSLMDKIEEFTKFVDDMNTKAKHMDIELDQMPANANLATRNLGQSGDSSKTRIPQQYAGNNMEKSLSEVMDVMYGLPSDVASDIERSLPSRKLVSEALIKIKNDSTFLDVVDRKTEEFDPMGFLGNEVVSENYKPEDAETLDWENFSIAKENFEDKVMDLLDEDKQNVDANSQKDKILKATRDFVFHMEIVLCELLHIFYEIMSGYEPAESKFQKFNDALKDVKESQKGMAPIIVYKVLAMAPQISSQGVESDEKEALYKEIEFDAVIKGFHRVFFLLWVVLKRLTSHAQAILNMRVVTACQTTLGEAENLMREIAMKIYGVKSRLTKKREDDSSPAVTLTQPYTEEKEVSSESKAKDDMMRQN